jgi:hypothetical protein
MASTIRGNSLTRYFGEILCNTWKKLRFTTLMETESLHLNSFMLLAVTFGRLHGATPSEAFRLGKVFGAIMLKFNAEHCKTPITHGDISKFFELDKVPAKFLERITVRAPKAAKTSKKSIAAKKDFREV